MIYTLMYFDTPLIELSVKFEYSASREQQNEGETLCHI